jgi:hypothetical protein
MAGGGTVNKIRTFDTSQFACHMVQLLAGTCHSRYVCDCVPVERRQYLNP